MHKIHDKLENLSNLDKEKLEEMKLQYDPKSEDVFKEVWDLSDTSEDETIVKTLYEELAKLDIQTVQDSDNSESSTNTVIEAEKREKSPEKEKCPSPSTQQRWSKCSETQNVHHQDQQHAQQSFQPSQRRW